MRGDIARLLIRYLLLAGAVVLLNFCIPRLLPGDPLNFGSGEGLDVAIPLSAEQQAQLRAYYHLDRPLGGQLMAYLGDLARGDLGWSIARAAPVSDLIRDHLPWTLGLLLSALLVSALVGTALGILAGWFPGRARDRLLVSMTSATAAIPDFLIAIGLLLVFAIGLGWFPLLGGRSAFADYSDDVAGLARHALDIGWHLALPTAALALTGAAGFLLLARDATVSVHREPWLIAARAKGLRERQVAFRHVLPNVSLPLLTFFGLRLGNVLGGALVVERVFGIPGLGLLTFQAIGARDYPLLQAVFLLSSLGVLAANLAVELIYLRLGQRRGVGHG